MVSVKPHKISQKWVSHSKLFHVEAIRLRFSNGQEREFERINPFPVRAVIVVPLLDRETLLLVREYGAGIDDYHLSLPRGALNKDEDVLDGANRELMEEAGYGAQKLVHLKHLSILPGYMGSSMEVVLASELYPRQLPGDEPEPLEIVHWPVAELERLLDEDSFTDAAALAALFAARGQLLQKIGNSL